MTDLRTDEEEAIAAVRRAAVVEPLSPFSTARAARALDAAIDDDARARGRWTTARVAGVAVVAAASAAALVFTLALPSPAPVAASGVLDVAVAPVAPAAPVAPLAPVVQPDGIALEEARHTEDVGMVRPVRRARRTPLVESERLVRAGDTVGAARVLARAHAVDGAVPALTLLARRHPAAVSAIDDELARIGATDLMRLRCQHRLLHERDRRAMEACRAFGREHPQDPAARLLTFAAGRLAEDMGDLAWAEEEYSRALLLSPFAGLSGTDALLARARVRFAAGDVDEARADLRLYLHSEPAARRDADVANLATSLGL